MNRPLVFASFFLCLGAAAAFYLGIKPVFAAGVFIIWGILVLSVLKLKKTGNAMAALSLLAAFGLFISSCALYLRPSNSISSMDERTYASYSEVMVNVTSIPDDSPGETVLEAGVISLKNHKGSLDNVSGKVKVRIKRRVNLNISYGDELLIKALLSKPRDGFEKQRMFAGGFDAVIGASDENIRVIGHKPKNFFMDLSQKARTVMINIIYASVPLEQARITEGLLLGSQRMVPSAVYDEFIRTGTVHILAVSGANAGIVCMAVLVLLRLLRCGKKFSAAVTVLCVWLFCCATGASESIVRASVMASFMLAAPVIGRDNDALNSLSAAAFFMVLIDPLCVLSVGFQMSFLAALGIIYMSEWLDEKMYFFPEVVRPLVTSTVAAQIFVLPVLVNAFGRVSIVSFLANLIIVPVASLITVSGFFMWISGLFSAKLAMVFGASCWLLVKVMTAANWLFASAPWASFNVTAVHPFFIAFYFVLILSLVHGDVDIRIMKRFRVKYAALFLLSALFTAHALIPAVPENTAIVAGLKGGNACLIRSERITLITAGCARNHEFEKSVNGFLKKHGINRTDCRISIQTGEKAMESGFLPSYVKAAKNGNYYEVKASETVIMIGADAACSGDIKGRTVVSCFYPPEGCGRNRNVYVNSSCYGVRKPPVDGIKLSGRELTFKMDNEEAGQWK